MESSDLETTTEIISTDEFKQLKLSEDELNNHAIIIKELDSYE